MIRYITVLSIIVSLLTVFVFSVNAQSIDSVRIDYKKIYSYCLDADVKSALELINVEKSKVSEKDKEFIEEFERRFAFPEDISDFIYNHSSEISPLLLIFHEYWREMLLTPEVNIDSLFLNKTSDFFSKQYMFEMPQMDEETLDKYFTQYISEFGLYATSGIGKVGKLYDLLVWRNQRDSVFTFNLHNEDLQVKVVLMNDFITLGWEEYATLGRYYPGGWATNDALYCVEKAYDLNSESFSVSYLAHEGRHFSDYKMFPELSNTDLEYRAKLTELSLARTTLINLIQKFIDNSNANSESGHHRANFMVISDLSKKLFGNPFEKNIEKWENEDIEIINMAAYFILQQNTVNLLSSTDKSLLFE